MTDPAPTPAAGSDQQASVQRYAATLDDLTPAERRRRLTVLADFAVFVDRDPDQMVTEIFDEETRKYRKRGHYTNKAKEFAATYDESPNARLQRANLIRAFFIANGRRLLAEQPAWLKTQLGRDSDED